MILRLVKNSDYFGASRYTGYAAKSLKLTLECGHEVSRKASQGIPFRARCRDCEHLEQGGRLSFGDWQDSPTRTFEERQRVLKEGPY